MSHVNRTMSKLAWVYLGMVFALSTLAATVFVAFNWQPIPVEQWIIFGALVTLAVLAQFYEIKGSERQSYYPHTVFFFAGVILLPPALYVLLIVLPHLLEWAYKRLTNSGFLRDWYLQPFNISTHILAGTVAHLIYHSDVAWAGILPFVYGAEGDVFRAYLAIFAYILVNHALIGQALVLARGLSWHESGVMDGQNVLTEVVLATLGYILAILWVVNPWLLLPLVSSLLLLSQALMVPQLKKEAEIDSKTGLFNARHFHNRFVAELQRAQRFEHPLSLILADLDLLREINNAHGHLTGDAVIQGVASQIRQQLREYDVAGRFGGEEFALVLPETTGHEAKMIAEKLRDAVENALFQEETTETKVRATISLGVANYPDDADSVERLIHEADTALYRAKYHGRNCVTMAADTPHSSRIRPAGTPHEILLVASAESGKPEKPAKLPLAAQPGANQPAGAQSAQTEQAPEFASSQASTMRRPVFIYSVILLAMVVAGFGFFSISDLDWKGIIIFLLLAALAEANQIELFENNTVSVSVAATFAAAIVGGIPGAAMAGAVIAIIHYVKMRPDWYKSAFNWSVHLLAALPAALFPVVTSRLNIQFETTFLAVLILLAIPVIALVYLIESGLMATVMGLSMRTSVVLLWRERFQWLGINYLVLGILGLFLAIGYLQIGLGSVVLFILPVLVMYATQKMYIQRTRSSVRELRRMNEELSQANVEIVKANHEIQRMNDQLFLTLAKVIDARDRDVAGHAARVSAYATAIATHLELPGEKREQIRQAALLHDIGKLGIPEKILSKTTRLSKEEFEIVKQHAELGAELLETIDVLRQLAPAVRHHHEHWNGNGYPYGLKQDEIPLDARILAISDAVEVMLSGRPYEPAKSIHEVLEEVRSHMGTQFDPLVAQAFIELAGTTQNLGIHSAANDALWPTTDEDPQRSDKPRVHPLRPVATVS